MRRSQTAKFQTTEAHNTSNLNTYPLHTRAFHHTTNPGWMNPWTAHLSRSAVQYNWLLFGSVEYTYVYGSETRRGLEDEAAGAKVGDNGTGWTGQKDGGTGLGNRESRDGGQDAG